MYTYYFPNEPTNRLPALHRTLTLSSPHLKLPSSVYNSLSKKKNAWPGFSKTIERTSPVHGCLKEGIKEMTVWLFCKNQECIKNIVPLKASYFQILRTYRRSPLIAFKKTETLLLHLNSVHSSFDKNVKCQISNITNINICVDLTTHSIDIPSFFWESLK